MLECDKCGVVMLSGIVWWFENVWWRWFQQKQKIELLGEWQIPQLKQEGQSAEEGMRKWTGTCERTR